MLGEVQRARPGLRPVLFGTPWEAAVWSILTQRTQHRQALRVREELMAAAGTPLSLEGRTYRPFPAPEAVLELGELPLPSVKAERVRGVAQAALDGELDPDRLRGMDPEDAMAAVRELPGHRAVLGRAHRDPWGRRRRRAGDGGAAGPRAWPRSATTTPRSRSPTRSRRSPSAGGRGARGRRSRCGRLRLAG